MIVLKVHSSHLLFVIMWHSFFPIPLLAFPWHDCFVLCREVVRCEVMRCCVVKLCGRTVTVSRV